MLDAALLCLPSSWWGSLVCQGQLGSSVHVQALCKLSTGHQGIAWPWEEVSRSGKLHRAPEGIASSRLGSRDCQRLPGSTPPYPPTANGLLLLHLLHLRQARGNDLGQQLVTVGSTLVDSGSGFTPPNPPTANRPCRHKVDINLHDSEPDQLVYLNEIFGFI